MAAGPRLVRDRVHRDAGHAGQHLAAHLLRGAGVGKAHLAGLGLGEVDELLQRLGRHVVVDGHHQRHRPHVAHRRERLVLVVGQLLHQELQRRIGAVGADEDGVAVGRRLGHGVGTQHAAGAGLVLDDDLAWPSVADIFSAKARPIWSVALPAAKGTTARMGLVG
jgi:hypothetical protein